MIGEGLLKETGQWMANLPQQILIVALAIALLSGAVYLRLVWKSPPYKYGKSNKIKPTTIEIKDYNKIMRDNSFTKKEIALIAVSTIGALIMAAITLVTL